MYSELVLSALLVLAFISLILLVSYIVEQQRLLQSIRPQNQRISPDTVWLQLIPIYGLFFQFRLVARIAESIRSELTTVPESDWLSVGQFEGQRPTYKAGRMYAICCLCTVIPIPILQPLIVLSAIVCWIIYWMQLRKYRQLILQHLASMPVE